MESKFYLMSGYEEKNIRIGEEMTNGGIEVIRRCGVKVIELPWREHSQAMENIYPKVSACGDIMLFKYNEGGDFVTWSSEDPKKAMEELKGVLGVCKDLFERDGRCLTVLLYKGARLSKNALLHLAEKYPEEVCWEKWQANVPVRRGNDLKM